MITTGNGCQSSQAPDAQGSNARGSPDDSPTLSHVPYQEASAHSLPGQGVKQQRVSAQCVDRRWHQSPREFVLPPRGSREQAQYVGNDWNGLRTGMRSNASAVPPQLEGERQTNSLSYSGGPTKHTIATADIGSSSFQREIFPLLSPPPTVSYCHPRYTAHYVGPEENAIRTPHLDPFTFSNVSRRYALNSNPLGREYLPVHSYIDPLLNIDESTKAAIVPATNGSLVGNTDFPIAGNRDSDEDLDDLRNWAVGPVAAPLRVMVKAKQKRMVSAAADGQMERSRSKDAIWKKRGRRITSVEGWPSEAPPSSALRWSLCCLILVAVFTNYDHGAIPACLSDIADEFHIHYTQQSLVGSLVYLGLLSGALIAGAVFQSIEARWILICSTAGLAVSVYSLSHSKSLLFVYALRIANGFFQAFPTVYIPVWIDEFAPERSAAQWMSLTQLASILGTAVGYLVGGLVTKSVAVHRTVNPDIPAIPEAPSGHSWHAVFKLQAAAALLVALALWLLPHSALNIKLLRCPVPPRRIISSDGDVERASDRQIPEWFCWNLIKTSVGQALELLRMKVFVLTTLAMSNLYFVVFGIQFWVTSFLTSVLGIDQVLAVSVTTFSFLTAPTTGVFTGGYLCDLLGGYKSQTNRVGAAKLCVKLAGAATVCAGFAAIARSMWSFAISLWLCLFFGAAVTPVALGLGMSIVPSSLRPVSSAVAQFCYNILGWFLAPLLSGSLMDVLSTWGMKEPEPLRWGLRFILSTSIIGLGCIVAARMTVDAPQCDRTKGISIELT